MEHREENLWQEPWESTPEGSENLELQRSRQHKSPGDRERSRVSKASLQELGQLDSNQRTAGVKVLCLTAWRWPKIF